MSRKSMNGKRRSRLRAISAILLITIAIYACGGSKSAYSETGAGAPAAAEEEIAYDTSASYDAGATLKQSAAYTGETCEYEMADEAAAAEEYAQEGSGQDTVAARDTSRKLIKTVNISAETEEFDTLVPGLQRQVETLGGYIESISVYDVNSYYVDDQMVKQRCRRMAGSGRHGAAAFYEKSSPMAHLCSLGNGGGPAFMPLFSGKPSESDSKSPAVRPL